MKRLALLSAFILIYSSQLLAQGHYGANRRHHGGVSIQVQTYPVRPYQAPVVINQCNTAPAPCAPVYIEGMNNYQFQSAYNSIRYQTFDNGKLYVTEQVIQSNYLYSWQVKEFMQLMTFENNKLEVAKMAYGKTLDKENYYQVNDAFTFGSTARELNRYLY